MYSESTSTMAVPSPTTTTTVGTTTSTPNIASGETADFNPRKKRRPSHKSSSKKKKKKVSRKTLSRLSFADDIDDSGFGSALSPGAENLGVASSLSGATAARFKEEKTKRRREKKRISVLNDRTRMGLLSSTAQPFSTPTSIEATSTMHAKHHLCLERAQISVSETIGRRSYMEDRHTVIPEFTQPAHPLDSRSTCSFVAVYDGHGGASVAECAQVRA